MHPELFQLGAKLCDFGLGGAASRLFLTGGEKPPARRSIGYPHRTSVFGRSKEEVGRLGVEPALRIGLDLPIPPIGRETISGQLEAILREEGGSTTRYSGIPARW